MSKGTLDDVLYALVAGVFIALIFFFMAFISFELNDQVQNNTAFNNESKVAFENIITTGFDVMLGAFPFIYFGLFIVAFTLAFRVGAHPIFALVSFILLGIMIIIAALLGEIWSAIVNEPEFATAVTARYPQVDFIMRNQSALTAIMGTIMIITLYARVPKDRVGQR